MNKGLQEINIENMNIELVAQMFKNYQSNVLFHLEGIFPLRQHPPVCCVKPLTSPSYRQLERSVLIPQSMHGLAIGRNGCYDYYEHEIP